ncbi:MAG TPA: sigma-70 family RNA polymerase sigma factor [Thermoanaerobaculia bacterium]|nr:sigma-70 family RNA polymerase sigma factor [Thermoanaerobaculia bacterium]
MAITDDLGPGDQACMDTPDELFRRYYRPVVAFFMKRGFSSEESRDLAQETFLRVFNKWDSFRGESSVETWLFQIAANLYKNQIRALQTQKRDAQETSLDSADGALELGSRETDPLKVVLTEEESRLLWEAVEALPPQMKQAVFLRVGKDLKYREIADLMHVSIETVKAHLYQARQQLRDRLADYFTDSEF